MNIKTLWKHPIGKVRLLGGVEGLSFLALVFVGMPLKYMQGQPMGVRILGPVHGALFLWVLWELAALVFTHGFGVKKAAVVFLATLFPFGPFLIDGWLKKQELSEA